MLFVIVLHKFYEDLTMQFILLLIVSFFVGGCSARYADFFPYHDNGTKKPFVTLLPTYNASQVEGSEEIARPLTKQIRNRLKRKGKVYCPPEELALRTLRSVSLEELAHTKEIELFKKFTGTDYVCLMELAEYKITQYKRNMFNPLYIASIPEESADVLMLAVRVHIVDVRDSPAKYVRQELVQSNHMIPRDFAEANIDMVRSRLARDIAEKIEQTVCVKK